MILGLQGHCQAAVTSHYRRNRPLSSCLHFCVPLPHQFRVFICCAFLDLHRDFFWKHPELVPQISIIKRQYIVVLRGSYFIARSIVVYKYSELRLDFDISNGYLEFESSRYTITFLICVSFFVLPIFKFYWLRAVLVWTFFWHR